MTIEIARAPTTQPTAHHAGRPASVGLSVSAETVLAETYVELFAAQPQHLCRM